MAIKTVVCLCVTKTTGLHSVGLEDSNTRYGKLNAITHYRKAKVEHVQLQIDTQNPFHNKNKIIEIKTD